MTSRGIYVRKALALRAYYRGAEYPMGRLRAIITALRQARVWPR
jgi:hypothetical protein